MPDFQYTPTVKATTPGSRVRFETDATSMVPASVYFGSGIGGAPDQSVPGGVLRSGGADGTIATVYGYAPTVVTRMYTGGVPGAVLETITGVDLLPDNPTGPTTLYTVQWDGTNFRANGQIIGSGTPTPGDTTAPQISSFTTSAGDSQVMLAWSGTDNVGITGWTLKRGGTTVYSGTATSFTDTGLTNGTTYTYALTASDAAGNVSAASSTTATPTATVLTGYGNNYGNGYGG